MRVDSKEKIGTGGGPAEAELVDAGATGDLSVAGSSLPAAVDGAGVVPALDACRRFLAEARDDLERLSARDHAKAVAAAAAVLERGDVLVAAAELVSDAERAIHRANPPRTAAEAGARKGKKGVPRGDALPSSLIRRIRHAHSKVDDGEYEALKAEHRSAGKPITRQSLSEHAKARDRAERQRSADARRAGAAGRRSPPAVSGFACAVAHLPGHVDAGSVDLIVTDPPYSAEALGCWRDLGAFASHALKPGGLLVAMSGNRYLPEVLNLTLEGGCGPLRWWWQGAYFMRSGGTAAFWDRGVFQSWKPLLIFSKDGGPAGRDRRWVNDTMVVEPPGGGGGGGHHPQGQSLAGAEAIISKFASEGDLVCDPFCGGGAIPVAALPVAGAVIYADADQSSVDKTTDRLNAALSTLDAATPAVG